MKEHNKKGYLPESGDFSTPIKNEEAEPEGDAPCPCCGCITIPNGGDALAYICPVCFWEVDSFIQSAQEPSDQNHRLTLAQAKSNYAQYGAVTPELKVYCRNPKASELSRAYVQEEAPAVKS